MWRTPFKEHVRVLQGHERRLFVAGVASLWCMYNNEWDLEEPDVEQLEEVGVTLFDAMDARTRIWAIAFVARHLLDPNLKEPMQLAWSEATIAAIFENIVTNIACELDNDEPRSKFRYYWRKLVFSALKENYDLDDDDDNVHSHRHKNFEDWCNVVMDEISELILWDIDWEHSPLGPIDQLPLCTGHEESPTYYSMPPCPSVKALAEATTYLIGLTKECNADAHRSSR
jgi:hypothetical protein